MNQFKKKYLLLEQPHEFAYAQQLGKVEWLTVGMFYQENVHSKSGGE
ncbi:hypothetical protein HQN89_36765 [Paenibacillus frigoriresistens]|nr:hypothetical protein [Paenibacillus frigoriresistens]